MFGKTTVEELLKEQIELLRVENRDLKTQVKNLQDAIVSKIAPIAYADMKASEVSPEEAEAQKEAIKNWEEEMSVYKRYAAASEQPFFKDGEDLKDKLSRMITPPNPIDVSLHKNKES